tara:strand:- start:144 stop:491 length:348 start_codon:yes stop_codon:yes gene_type:complete
MWSNIRLSIYGLTALAGLIWPFYFIAKFVSQVQSGSVGSSVIEIANTFIDGAWATPTSGFVSADTAVLLIGIFIFYAAEGEKTSNEIVGYLLPSYFSYFISFFFWRLYVYERKNN